MQKKRFSHEVAYLFAGILLEAYVRRCIITKSVTIVEWLSLLPK